MLKDFITSRVRVKLLTLLLSGSDKIYHVREIVRRINEEINAVRRGLLHMEKSGMVVKEPRANRLYYSFRKSYPLYFELSELVTKTSGLGGEIYRNRVKLGKIKFVMFSGKFLRNIASGNNIDILVVGTVVLPELAQMIRSEEGRLGKEIDYTVMSEEEFSFRKTRRDPFILGILSGARTMIIGDEEELAS